MKKPKNLLNQKFGRLTVIEKANNRVDSNGISYVYWKCECICGKIKEIRGSALTRHSRPTLSCGCLFIEMLKSTGRSNYKGPGIAGVNSLFTRYKRGARDRNLEFTISKDEFREFLFKECYYCGDGPKGNWRRTEAKHHLIYNGIDRKNSNYGYIKDNLVTCCRICNKAKMEISDKDFIDLAKKIAGKHS